MVNPSASSRRNSGQLAQSGTRLELAISTRGAHSWVRSTPDRAAGHHQHGLVGGQLAQRGHDGVEARPVPGRLAGAAVDDQVGRPLGDLGVEVVAEHPQRGLGRPGFGRCARCRGRRGRRAGTRSIRSPATLAARRRPSSRRRCSTGGSCTATSFVERAVVAPRGVAVLDGAGVAGAGRRAPGPGRAVDRAAPGAPAPRRAAPGARLPVHLLLAAPAPAGALAARAGVALRGADELLAVPGYVRDGDDRPARPGGAAAAAAAHRRGSCATCSPRPRPARRG